MTLRTIAVSLALFALVVFVSFTNARSNDREDHLDRQSRIQRLESLRPDKPIDYFLLAEDFADDIKTNNDRELAIHLFALAGALDPEQLGRSACLALVELESDDRQEEMLLALGSLLDPKYDFTWRLIDDTGTLQVGPSVLTFLEAVSRFRKGDGARAITAINQPGVAELVEMYGHLLPGGANGFLKECESIRGGPVPDISLSTQIQLLRLDAGLLAGDDRTWSEDLLITGAQPFLDVNPMRLDEMFGVDVERPFFRDGQWVRR